MIPASPIAALAGELDGPVRCGLPLRGCVRARPFGDDEVELAAPPADSARGAQLVSISRRLHADIHVTPMVFGPGDNPWTHPPGYQWCHGVDAALERKW